MNLKLTIKTSKKIGIFLKICCIPLILAILAGLVYFAYEQYIIYRVEKTYNMLREAYVKTLETANFKWEEGKMNTDVLAEAFIKNLPVEKNCEYTNDGTCFAKRVYFTKESVGHKGTGINLVISYKVLLKDGSAIAFRNISPTCNLLRGRCGSVYIDANGPFKGPNMLSRDIFDFVIFKDKIGPYSIKGNHYPNCVYGGGHACGAYLLQFRNRNYKSYKNYVKRHHIENVNFDSPFEKKPF